MNEKSLVADEKVDLILNDDMTEDVRVVIFEDINYLYYPLLFFFLIQSQCSVYIFDFRYQLKKYKWIKRLINRGDLKRIYVKPSTEEHGLAIDGVGRLVDTLGLEKTIGVIEKQCSLKNVRLYSKKSLLEYLFSYIYIDSFLSELSVKRKRDDFIFIPTDYLLYRYWANKANIACKYEFRFGLSRKVLLMILFVKDLLRKMFFYVPAIILYVGYIAAITVRNMSISKGDRSPIKCTNIFAIQHEYQLNYKGVRSFDFLFSDYSEKHDDPVYISDVPNMKTKIDRENLNVIDVTNASTVYGEVDTLVNVVKAIPILLSLAPLLMVPGSVYHAYLGLLITYLKWDQILGRMEFDRFIYTNSEGPRQIVINEIVRKYDSESWAYNVFMGGGYLRSTSLDYRNSRHILWAFLNYDHFIAANSEIVEYYRLHQQDVRNYHICGLLSGEMIRSASEMIRSDGEEDWRSGRGKYFGEELCRPEYSLISVFDTSFIDEISAHSSFVDCIDFYKDILKLIDENEKYICIIKPSKNERSYIDPDLQWSAPSRAGELLEIWNMVKGHQRINWVGDTGDSSLIMSMSDLVVTHCFSSTSGEALAARRKAFWYESGKGHRNMYLDRVPRLVAHGYSELQQTVEFFLDLSDDDFHQYLEGNIKGLVDEYLDCQGLTRFRNLLGIGSEVTNTHER